MKKVFSVLLILTLVLSFGTMSVFADSENLNATGNKDIDVEAKYADGTTTPTVYSVDPSWGAMEFTYNASGTKDWNPVTHGYDLDVSASWSASGNVITVTNHSNTAVTAGFAYGKATGFETVNGAFNNATLPLDTADGVAFGSAPSGTTTLTLSGTIANTVTSFTKVGTITVTLS